jgi:hypothetical protein
MSFNSFVRTFMLHDALKHTRELLARDVYAGMNLPALLVLELLLFARKFLRVKLNKVREL